MGKGGDHEPVPAYQVRTTTAVSAHFSNRQLAAQASDVHLREDEGVAVSIERGRLPFNRSKDAKQRKAKPQVRQVLSSACLSLSFAAAFLRFRSTAQTICLRLLSGNDR